MEKIAENLILIIDDEPGDQQLLARMLRRLGVTNAIYKLSDGHEAIRYFNGDSPYDDRTLHPLPAVVFLDLKLPIISGFEVLDWMHGTSSKRDSHLFIYSEIGNVTNVRRIYSLGADSFLRKPVQEVDLMNLIYHFPKFWQIKADKALEERTQDKAEADD
jgi:two-component system response regulator